MLSTESNLQEHIDECAKMGGLIKEMLPGSPYSILALEGIKYFTGFHQSVLDNTWINLLGQEYSNTNFENPNIEEDDVLLYLAEPSKDAKVTASSRETAAAKAICEYGNVCFIKVTPKKSGFNLLQRETSCSPTGKQTASLRIH